jgi:hypothetical protein
MKIELLKAFLHPPEVQPQEFFHKCHEQFIVRFQVEYRLVGWLVNYLPNVKIIDFPFEIHQRY